jgi:hypothetical protein
LHLQGLQVLLQQEEPQQPVVQGDQQTCPQEAQAQIYAVNQYIFNICIVMKSDHLRSSRQPNLPRCTPHHTRPIYTLLRRLRQLGIIRNLLRVRRIHNHDLALLAMRARRTVKEHGLRARDGHIEGADVSLAVLEWNVAAVDAAVHGFAGCVNGGLRDSVVAIGELELDYVADGGNNGVGDKGVLRAADDYGDDLILALEGAGWWFMLVCMERYVVFGRVCL